MKKELNELRLAKAGAGVSAIGMVALSLLAKAGIYMGAAQQMMKWHMWYDLSAVGILTGTLEGAVHGFVLLYVFGWLYNKCA